MGRRAKSPKGKVEAKRPLARKSPKTDDANVRDLEKRLAATSEILRIIGSSPTDAQPVFDTIVQSAVRLLRGRAGSITRIVGDQLDLVALTSTDEAGDAAQAARFPMSIHSEEDHARAVRDRAPLNSGDAPSDSRLSEAGRVSAHLRGYRSLVVVPLLRHNEVVGTLGVARTEPGGFAADEIALLETFADQAVIAIENVRLFTELQSSNRDLTEALDQQTATAEILRVISSSPTDGQPIFDAIARNARRLLGGHTVSVACLTGDELHLMAFNATDAVADAVLQGFFPVPVDRFAVIARVVRERIPVIVTDMDTDPQVSEDIREIGRARGWRSVLWMPMVRDEASIGMIAVSRRDPGPFADGEVALLKTFADQAVIAIENVRLFTELQQKNEALTQAHAQVTEALDQQTATSEILGVISRSPTDVQPVFDAIVESAARLCDAFNAAVLSFDGELMRVEATCNWAPGALDVARRSGFIEGAPPSRAAIAGRAILERAVVHVPDVERDPEYLHELRRAGAFRSVLSVPMLRDGIPLGAISVGRAEPGLFSDNQIALLKTFADQAVIALENVRLFTELQASNRELTTALDTQTATSDILRVISGSRTDVQPVFDAILGSAIRLLGAYSGTLTRVAREQIEIAATTSTGNAGDEAVRARFPQPLSSAGLHPRAIRDRVPLNIADAHTDPRLPETFHAYARVRGYQSQVIVPMIHHDEAIGAISVTRREPGGFTDDEIALLQTFADQAVIAIENVRLFTELREKNEALTDAHAQVSESLDQQTATSEILRVISSSPTDGRPVFDVIAQNAMRLCDGSFCAVSQYDGDVLHLAAHAHVTAEGIESMKQLFPLRPSRATVAGRVVIGGTVVHIPDVQTDPEYLQPFAEALRAQSGLGVPMLRDSATVGVIVVGRVEARPFTEREITLLQTFADQAVIAIENVRLFTELEARNRDLTATSQILSVISRSPTEVQPVFDTIVASASRLCDAVYSVLATFDGKLVDVVAAHNWTPAAWEAARRIFPAPPSRALATGRAILERAVINLPDIQLDPEYQEAISRAAGARSILAVPMLREGAVTGAIAVARAQPGSFSENQVELMKTFADQAVIGIENARLLTELQTRTAELTRSVGELTALGEVSRTLSSTLNLETVLQTIVLRANELAGTAGCTIWEYDEAREQFRLRVSHYTDESDTALLQALGQMATIPKGPGVTTQVVERRQAVQIPDITVSGAYEHPIRGPLIEAGHRALLGVPLLSEDEVIGVLTVTRKAPGEFPPETVQLLQTFATQSALAIQNARLFLEIEDKSRQLEVASRHKSEFLASMSHELRTPLNGILGFNEMILDDVYGEVPADLREPLTEIQNSGRHLLRLINNVLDLSKIEAGRMELALGDYAVQDTVAQVRASLYSLAADKGLEFVTAVPTDLPLAHGDVGRITQCLTNLAGNAIKFTRQGRVEIAVELQGELLVYRVSDTGIGIPSDRIDTLFTEFRQADATIASEFGGSGLGLSITRKFAEMHGGRVWVESEPGKGSKFFLAVPLRLGGGVPA